MTTKTEPTEQERQELREWAARKMGWIWSNEFSAWVLNSERGADGRLTNCYPDQLPVFDTGDESGPFWEQLLWHPDTDLNQAFMLVEKMRENGYYLSFNNESGQAIFYSRSGKQNNAWANDSNPALAILKAARATAAHLKEAAGRE